MAASASVGGHAVPEVLERRCWINEASAFGAANPLLGRCCR
jgi:hypothetical protein